MGVIAGSTQKLSRSRKPYLRCTKLITFHILYLLTQISKQKLSLKLVYSTIQGLHHNDTIKCEDVDGCLCKSSRGIPSCLSSSPVQFLTIWKFGEICDDSDDMEKQIELVMYFLETMPNLEEMKSFYDTQIDEDVISKLQMLVTSSKCTVYIFPEV